MSPPSVLSRLRLLAAIVLWSAAPLSPVRADRIIYDFSGKLSVTGSDTSEAPPFARGDAFFGSIDFYDQAAYIPPVKDRWFKYRPTGRMTFSIGEQSWSNTALTDAPCDVATFLGWPSIEFLCRFPVPDNPDWVLRLQFLARKGPVRLEPYPEGPFAPDSFRALTIEGELLFLNPTLGIARGLVNLDEVRRIDEPPMALLALSLALGMGMVRRHLRRTSSSRSLPS